MGRDEFQYFQIPFDQFTKHFVQKKTAEPPKHLQNVGGRKSSHTRGQVAAMCEQPEALVRLRSLDTHVLSTDDGAVLHVEQRPRRVHKSLPSGSTYIRHEGVHADSCSVQQTRESDATELLGLDDLSGSYCARRSINRVSFLAFQRPRLGHS